MVTEMVYTFYYGVQTRFSNSLNNSNVYLYVKNTEAPFVEIMGNLLITFSIFLLSSVCNFRSLGYSPSRVCLINEESKITKGGGI